MYVHDPETNGKYYAWLAGPHGPSAKLYVWDGSGTPVAAAEGAGEFGIAENFVAYGKDEAVWIYVFENGKSYRLTPERENTQFLGVSVGYVRWMDATSRERDIIKYALPPLYYGRSEIPKKRSHTAKRKKGCGRFFMKEKTKFVCGECGYETVKWMGCCPLCGSWHAL